MDYFELNIELVFCSDHGLRLTEEEIIDILVFFGKVEYWKILNLYAGIGGNRKLWGNEHDITVVEINPNIAKVYKELFPNDNVIIGVYDVDGVFQTDTFLKNDLSKYQKEVIKEVYDKNLLDNQYYNLTFVRYSKQM